MVLAQSHGATSCMYSEATGNSNGKLVNWMAVRSLESNPWTLTTTLEPVQTLMMTWCTFASIMHLMTMEDAVLRQILRKHFEILIQHFPITD